MGLFVFLSALVGLLIAAALLVRFRPRWMAAFNLAVTNRITGHFAGRLPGFGIVIHRGRTSGKVYRTPVNVFRVQGEFLIALTYGRDSQWVRNVLAAGGCQLVTRGKLYELAGPAIVHDSSRRRFPWLVRLVLGTIAANDFMRISASPDQRWVESSGVSRGKIA
jgi:deazaflavin-dependent oxidoreductase (nitroreductase family)